MGTQMKNSGLSQHTNGAQPCLHDSNGLLGPRIHPSDAIKDEDAGPASKHTRKPQH